jgi:hypothetical protein
MIPVKHILALGILCMVFLAGCSTSNGTQGTTTPVPSKTIVTTYSPQVSASTIPSLAAPAAVETVTDPRFVNPLRLKSPYRFGNGTKWTSEAAINRIWINDTYRWYNPEELQYDTRTAPAGKTFLFLFVSMVNRGTDRAPLPPMGNIYVIADGVIIPHDSFHPLPMKNPDSTPRVARIAEIEYSRKVYTSELVEDYGYSHGQKLAYIEPGESNAVEGYIIYVVPDTIKPEKTYVTMVMPDKSEGVWVLG